MHMDTQDTAFIVSDEDGVVEVVLAKTAREAATAYRDKGLWDLPFVLVVSVLWGDSPENAQREEFSFNLGLSLEHSVP